MDPSMLMRMGQAAGAFQPPPQQSGLLGRISRPLGLLFGGQPSAGLSAEQNSEAARMARLQAGLQMLAASQGQVGGPAPHLAQILAMGAQTGQMAGGQARAQMGMQAAQERLQAVLSNPAARANPQAMQSLVFDLLMAGDSQGAKIVADMIQAAAMPERRLHFERDSETGEVIAFDPTTGAEVSRTARSAEGIAAVGSRRELEASGVRFGQEGEIAREFRTETERHQLLADNFGTILAAAQDPSGAGDIALITSFMKMLDPMSTVREGEYATAENAGGVPDRVRNLWNRFVDGEALAPDARADLVSRARRIADGQRRSFNGIAERYRARARGYGLNPDNVVYDYYAPVFGVPSSPPTAPASASPDPFGDL